MTNMKRRILVIDDNVDLCQTVQYLLQKNGPYEVRTESDSTKTLETIYEFRPEVILLDVTMPDVNGYDICERVKSDKILSFIKIIFVTGNVTKEQRMRGYEVGGDDYITKPFDNEELLAKVRVFLKLKYTEEMSQIKSNVLSILQDEKLGFFEKMFQSRPEKKEELPGMEGWEEMAKGKTAQAYDYIKNAMFLNKIMEGITISREDASIGKIVKESVHKVKHKASSKHIIFKLRENGDEKKVKLDGGLMLRALSCVLTNVILHSPKRAEYQIIINYDNPDYCEIYIEDSGHDFDDKNCDEVFNEFMEFTPQENKRGQDLSIVCAKRIAQLHEGDLSFQTDYEGFYSWVFQISYAQGELAINPMFY